MDAPSVSSGLVYCTTFRLDYRPKLYSRYPRYDNTKYWYSENSFYQVVLNNLHYTFTIFLINITLLIE